MLLVSCLFFSYNINHLGCYPHHTDFLTSVTVALGIAQVIMALTTTFYSTLTVPAMALENAMTCRVHRGIVLGLIDNSELEPQTRREMPVALTTVVWGSSQTDNTTVKEPDASHQV